MAPDLTKWQVYASDAPQKITALSVQSQTVNAVGSIGAASCKTNPPDCCIGDLCSQSWPAQMKLTFANGGGANQIPNMSVVLNYQYTFMLTGYTSPCYWALVPTPFTLTLPNFALSPVTATVLSIWVEVRPYYPSDYYIWGWFTFATEPPLNQSIPSGHTPVAQLVGPPSKISAPLDVGNGYVLSPLASWFGPFPCSDAPFQNGTSYVAYGWRDASPYGSVPDYTAGGTCSLSNA